jgi:choline dehydrogenase-like flavoprotein
MTDTERVILNLDAKSVIPAMDITIVGAGPVGIALALACEDRGLSVLLVESGLTWDDPSKATLSEADILDPACHAPMTVAVRRALGGTSRWWGGRCVPFDDIDFAQRPHVPDAKWPITHDAFSRWYPQAAAYFGLGEANFNAPPLRWGLKGAAFSSLERWAPKPNAVVLHGARLQMSSRIVVLLDATVTTMEFGSDNTTVHSIAVANAGAHLTLPVRHLVLACGGLETTRIMLAVQREKPSVFGGPEGVLGRYYAGHISGKIADLVMNDPADVSDQDFYRDGPAYARRRFTLTASTQMAERLLNTSFWIDNPPFHDPSHRNGVLSIVWLLLAQPTLGRRLLSEGVRLSHVGPRPFAVWRHVANVCARPFSTLSSAVAVAKGRLLNKPRKPGFLLRSRNGRYPLHYHAEQAPCRDSTVALSSENNAFGQPRLIIDLRFSEQDVQSVIQSHAQLDAALRDAGFGRLEYHAEAAQLPDRIRAQASDGFHQTGTTRMGSDPSSSIVDSDARVHGVANLFLASSSIFPSSGQANPTFLAVAAAIRLAEHLRQITPSPHCRT